MDNQCYLLTQIFGTGFIKFIYQFIQQPSAARLPPLSGHICFLYLRVHSYFHDQLFFMLLLG